MAAAEELPVRVLHPAGHHRFVTLIEGVLQVDEADHQPGVHAWPAELFGVTSVDGRVELRPVDPLGQHVQRMLGIQQFAQLAPNNSHCGVAAFGFIFLPAFEDLRDQNLANFSAMITAMHPLFVAAKEFFRDDYIVSEPNPFWRTTRGVVLAHEKPRQTKVGQTMSEGKDADRSRRKKRRGQLDREKETRRAEQSRTANLESKMKDEKAKLDLRIGKLIDQGYSPESVAKRVGVSVRRINSALDSNSRR